MIKLYHLPIFLFSTLVIATDVQNITGDQAAREKLFANSDNHGVRLSYNNMKQLNGALGLGSVDKIVLDYEKELSESLDLARLKQQDPNLTSVTIQKTDFKGYYITCKPSPKCAQVVNSNIPDLKVEAEYNGKQFNFSSTSTPADNYQQGYMRSRALSDPGFDGGDLHAFLKDKIDSGLKDALGSSSYSDLASTPDSFKTALKDNIELYRTKGIDSVDPKFQKIVEALDLMEVPFSASSNIQQAMTDALLPASNTNPDMPHITKAQTGDDLFTIIQRDGEVQKIIGADARGLGVLNMETRLDEYMKMDSSTGVKSLTDFQDLSMNGIRSADKIMDKSLDTYDQYVREEFNKPNGRTDDQIIKAAHDRYLASVEADPDLMQIRAASISNCGTNDCIMDRITAIHNRQKLLEKNGIDSVFGSSCLGTEYILRKKKLK